jgi:hypothetical protein
MSDPFAPRTRGFRDLVPWADPYIVALIEKLRRTDEFERGESGEVNELPPPLESDRERRDDHWPFDRPRPRG